MAKIMIIDDEAETLETHEEYLKNEHLVFPYRSGDKALDDVKKIKPDLILLDIEMPFMDGFQVLEILQEMAGFSKIPVIGVTGQKSKTTVLKFIAKGGSGYLTKPVSKQALLEKVEEVIEKENVKNARANILIVDDEIEALSVTKSMLETDYDVMALNSSKLALEYLGKYTPDLIILDYSMPLYDGKMLYQMIRRQEKFYNTPIMYLTGEDVNEILSESSPLPDAIVMKSSGKEVLLEKIESLLSHYREERKK